MEDLYHFFGGQRQKGSSGRFGRVFAPALGDVVAQVPLASRDEVHTVVERAVKAQEAWGQRPPHKRVRVLFDFLRLVRENTESLSRTLSQEHGKTLPDAVGDIERGLDAVEFACGMPHLQKGEYTSNVGAGVDLYSLRQPLGVVLGITPFNFPAMIPLWQCAPALAAGNAFILKPSERNPSVPLRLAELMTEAGLPEDVLTVLNGDQEAVEALLDHRDIQAVAFVGSTSVAQKIYNRAARSGKRAQCFGGAKNHMVIMPDADIDQAVNALVGAGYGSAGERCMAISVAVPVGEKTAEALVSALAEKVCALKVGPSLEEGTEMGPLISAEHRERVLSYVEQGVNEGATLVVDGRSFSLPGYEKGFYMGGCLFDHVKPSMTLYTEEIFGPVLSVVRASSYEEALSLPSSHRYGNGVALFTKDGDTARDFVERVDVGMVGINVPIPVPMAYYAFGGWKESFFGDLGQHGPDSVRFFTRTKTVTSRWLKGGLREQPNFSIAAKE